MAGAGEQFDFGCLGGQQGGLASGCPVPVQPAEPGPGRCEQFQLVVWFSDLDDQRGDGVAG